MDIGKFFDNLLNGSYPLWNWFTRDSFGDVVAMYVVGGSMVLVGFALLVAPALPKRARRAGTPFMVLGAASATLTCVSYLRMDGMAYHGGWPIAIYDEVRQTFVVELFVFAIIGTVIALATIITGIVFYFKTSNRWWEKSYTGRGLIGFGIVLVIYPFVMFTAAVQEKELVGTGYSSISGPPNVILIFVLAAGIGTIVSCYPGVKKWASTMREERQLRRNAQDYVDVTSGSGSNPLNLEKSRTRYPATSSWAPPSELDDDGQ